MLLELNSLSKQIAAKTLFSDVSFSINENEKVALIGRNGHGKSTLLKIIAGQDHDFLGKVIIKKGTNITLTNQEHAAVLEQTPLEYILKDVPRYYESKKIIDEYEQGKHTKLNLYLKTLDYFTENRYFHIEDAILGTLADFNISNELALQPLATLSGGQKRYVELTRMMFSQADLFLIDEPTNHLDYQGKKRFIKWMNSNKNAMIVVTHDRDVLKNVDKIIELKNKKIHVFSGNYDSYIKQNTATTASSVKEYTDQLNRLKEAKKKVEWGLRMRAKSKAWKIKYDQFVREYKKIEAETVKPSFWIDQNSIETLDKKVADSYDSFKEKNINITFKTKAEKGLELLKVTNLSLGYQQPLFDTVSLFIRDNDKVFIKGKNGAGKSTLVKTIIAHANNSNHSATIIDGTIAVSDKLRIGEYQQEIETKYLSMPLEEAIYASYENKNVPVTTSKVKSLLAQYLFDPIADANQRIGNLSGGQKARFQLITMFIGEPNLLILDEPTNHLDLPSIEELENSLTKFSGGIIYISHDSYFINKMGGQTISL